MNRLALLAVGASALGSAAIGLGGPAMAASTSSAMPAATHASSTAVVKTANTSVGKVLVASNGHTLYLFKADTGTKPTCTGSCAMTWPAATTSGKPHAASGVNVAMLATTAAPSGHAMQVTYHGHPQYYFSGDKAPGQVHGQGLQHLWYAVSPSGAADTSAPAHSSTAHPSPTHGSSGGSGGGYGY